MFSVQPQKSHNRTRSNARNTRNKRITPSISHVPAENPESGVMEWTKNTHYCVSKLPGYPRFFEKMNLNSPISGSTDSTTGYSMVITLSSVFIWSYISNEPDPPAIEFPLPEQSSPPLANLVTPSAGADEPGLLIVMANGYVAYWESIGDAVAEVMMKKRGVEGQISIPQTDICVGICNAEPAGFVVRTNVGKLFHLALRDPSGRPSINITHMGASSFWRYFSSTKEGIVALRAGKICGRGERQVLVMTHNGSVDIWDISRTGENKLNLQLQLEVPVNQHLQNSDIQTGTLEFHDIAHVPDTNTIIFLFSSNGTNYISTFDYNDIHVTSLIHLPANPTSPGRLHLPQPGKSVFVVYSNMILVLNDPGSYTFQDVIEFTCDINLLCSGQEDIMPKKRNPGVIVISKNDGVIRVETFQVDAQTGDLMKSKIEQAVFYSFVEKNPIKFSRPVDGTEIQTLVVEVSKEIISSRSKYLPPLLPSLKDHLALRSKSLVRLATYLQHTSLPQETRHILLHDLEKIEAARKLWDAWNDFRDDNEDILANVVKTIVSDQVSGDILRLFFTSFVDKIAKIVWKTNKLAVDKSLGEHDILGKICEANEIILKILRTAYKVRDERRNLYQITEESRVEPWTCTEAVLQAVSTQYELAIEVVKGAKEAELFDKIVGQIVGMADVLCRGFEERIQWGASEYRGKYESRRGGWIKALSV
ncbi:Nucleoporin nup132 [Neolecta irregularis DAH-3]|uniref:Nucleoporin nup132 n=1 Tax=Neolecta irregularis (strain DAH-3) TaxID=1198029 RepID=A0A1U7LLA4_NEOID|nr:Nucleoporin nup132 [Neolecta irregularis DAH-3]|eukprot:OLL23434.1 Nucleoporin nup132 [Neolecta irregularis DAH-3]